MKILLLDIITLSCRYSPVLATALNCLLSITTVVISDANNTNLWEKTENQQTSIESDDFYQLMLQNVTIHGGLSDQNTTNEKNQESKQESNSTNGIVSINLFHYLSLL